MEHATWWVFPVFLLGIYIHGGCHGLSVRDVGDNSDETEVTEDVPTPLEDGILLEWPENNRVIELGSSSTELRFRINITHPNFYSATLMHKPVGSDDHETLLLATPFWERFDSGYDDMVELVPNTTFDLRIVNAGRPIAGQYEAYVVDEDWGHESHAFNITVSAPPDCPEVSEVVRVGEVVSLQTEIRFAGPAVPSLTCTDCLGNTLNTTEMPDYALWPVYRSTITLTASHRFCDLTCNVTYDDDPTFSATCTRTVDIYNPAPMCNAQHHWTQNESLLLLGCFAEDETRPTSLYKWYGRHRGSTDRTEIDGDLKSLEVGELYRDSYLALVWSPGLFDEYVCLAYGGDGVDSCKITSKSAIACVGSSLTDELCPRPSVIEIYDITHHVRSAICNDGCCLPRPDDCGQSLHTLQPQLFDTMKKACSGRNSCQGVTVKPMDVTTCGGAKSQYMTLHYLCVDPVVRPDN